MSRAPAKITQADVARAIRAAKQAGAGAVKVLPDGTIHIDLQATKGVESQQNAVEQDVEIVL